HLAARRAECARRMGLRLASAIPRRAGLCGAAARISRFCGLWRYVAQRERVQELAHLDVRHCSVDQVACGTGCGGPETDSDRGLVLWRLCCANGGRDGLLAL